MLSGARPLPATRARAYWIWPGRFVREMAPRRYARPEIIQPPGFRPALPANDRGLHAEAPLKSAEITSPAGMHYSWAGEQQFCPNRRALGPDPRENS